MTRRLALKRENLTPLTTDEMSRVAGGTHLCWVTDHCQTGPTPSIDAYCPTVPVLVCLSIRPACFQTG